MRTTPMFDIAGVSNENDEWYTPSWMFEAMGVEFDLDPMQPRIAAVNSAGEAASHKRRQRAARAVVGFRVAQPAVQRQASMVRAVGAAWRRYRTDASTHRDA